MFFAISELQMPQKGLKGFSRPQEKERFFNLQFLFSFSEPRAPVRPVPPRQREGHHQGQRAHHRRYHRSQIRRSNSGGYESYRIKGFQGNLK